MLSGVEEVCDEELEVLPLGEMLFSELCVTVTATWQSSATARCAVCCIQIDVLSHGQGSDVM